MCVCTSASDVAERLSEPTSGRFKTRRARWLAGWLAAAVARTPGLVRTDGNLRCPNAPDTCFNFVFTFLPRSFYAYFYPERERRKNTFRPPPRRVHSTQNAVAHVTGATSAWRKRRPRIPGTRGQPGGGGGETDEQTYEQTDACGQTYIVVYAQIYTRVYTSPSNVLDSVTCKYLVHAFKVRLLYPSSVVSLRPTTYSSPETLFHLPAGVNRGGTVVISPLCA